MSFWGVVMVGLSQIVRKNEFVCGHDTEAVVVRETVELIPLSGKSKEPGGGVRRTYQSPPGRRSFGRPHRGRATDAGDEVDCTTARPDDP